MFLMKENKKIASFKTFKGKPSNIIEIFSKDDMPFGLQGSFADKNLMRWHSIRSIPRGRVNIKKIEKKLGNIDYLSINSLGLSLTDHYWYKDESSSLDWEDINFFDNDFSPDLFLLENDLLEKQNLSPDYTTNGTLKKFWIIDNNTPYLLKAGGFDDNSKILAANEVIAYKIANVLDIPATEYKKIEYGGQVFCSCPLFLNGKTEEFVSFRQIEMQLNTYNDNFLVKKYVENLGFSDYLDDLALFNILIHNYDCHFDNAGLIKEVNSNNFIRPCKLFDNGSSLNWSNNKIGAANMKPFEPALEEYVKTIKKDITLPDIKDLENIIKNTYNDFNISQKQTNIAIAELRNSYEIINQELILEENNQYEYI